MAKDGKADRMHACYKFLMNIALKLHSSSTVIASVGHEIKQALHRIQSSGLTGTDFECGYLARSAMYAC